MLGRERWQNAIDVRDAYTSINDKLRDSLALLDEVDAEREQVVEKTTQLHKRCEKMMRVVWDGLYARVLYIKCTHAHVKTAVAQAHLSFMFGYYSHRLVGRVCSYTMWNSHNVDGQHDPGMRTH